MQSAPAGLTGLAGAPAWTGANGAAGNGGRNRRTRRQRRTRHQRQQRHKRHQRHHHAALGDTGSTALPTASPPTTVVQLAVPAGKYVILAKTQLSHTGAGDSVDCWLKAGATTLDQIAMKTLPALAAIPASLQAVVTLSSITQLSVVRCFTANGAANFSSLIAMPTS